MSRNYSPQQRAVFAWFEKPSGSLVVRARAGTGKTTTIVEALNHAPAGYRMLLCAFNKKIAEELSARIKAPNAEAKTLHAIGFALIRRQWTSVRVDGDRGRNLAQRAAGTDAPDAMVNLVARLASIGKGVLPFAVEGNGRAVESMIDLAFDHDLTPDEEWEEDGWDVERIARTAIAAMKLALDRDGVIDFDDMVYIPVAKRWGRPTYDVVIVDECQDMNAAQIELARRVARGSIVAVGDDRQAIYGFRGADSGSLDRIKAEYSAAESPLTVTYRCAARIVADAKAIVPDYEAAPNAPDGIVRKIPQDRLTAEAQPGDFILSRKNAPLMGACLSLLKAGKRAKVEGRDVGKALVALLAKFKARSVPDLLRKIATWEEKEGNRVKAAAKTPEKGEARQAEIVDKAECLRALCEGMASVAEIKSRIESLFADTDGAPAWIVCSSVHKAKGLEADRAFLLDWTFRATTREESNIRYVAITRARHELVYVTQDAPAAPPPAA